MKKEDGIKKSILKSLIRKKLHVNEIKISHKVKNKVSKSEIFELGGSIKKSNTNVRARAGRIVDRQYNKLKFRRSLVQNRTAKHTLDIY